MNFKATSLCVLSVSLLVQSPNILAAKKSTLDEVKALQSALIKNKNSIENLLNNKAHRIAKETEAMISGPGAGSYTNKQPLYGAIRQMSLDAIKSEQHADLFSGPDAMENLLKRYRMSAEDRVESITNPTEKVYSITVLNTQNLEALKQINVEFLKVKKQEDDLIKRMNKYVELSMKGSRYITYKEAENLSAQIYKMNSDMQELEEISVKLSGKDQIAVEKFSQNINEWMNKKLVFTEINKKGFTAAITSDAIVYVERNAHLPSYYLNKDYTAANIANALKLAITKAVNESNKYYNGVSRHDHYLTLNGLRANNLSKNISEKIRSEDLDSLVVKVSEDRLSATISTKKFTMINMLRYSDVAKLIVSQNSKAFYDHDSQNTADYYNPNTSLLKAELKLVTGHEIQMKNLYKNFGQEKFGTDLGKVDFSVK